MIRLGTRGSELALRQSNLVADRLRAKEPVELVVIHTRGDASDRPFREIEGRAFFTKELDEALLERRIDLAVHSLKDLPTDEPRGLFTICVLPRADARDVLLLRSGAVKVAPGMRIGTSSARRVAQLAAEFPGVDVVDLRGNVPTRVEKLRRGDYDGIVIAAAGIDRLGLDLNGLTRIALEPPRFLPAPGQGVLACRVREDDPVLAAKLGDLIDPDSAACAHAERGLLERLDGGCSLPLGALAQRVGRGIVRIVMHASLERDGRLVRARVDAATPEAAAEAAKRALLAPAAAAPMLPTVLLTRPDGLDDELAETLRERGFAVLSQPAIEFDELPLDDEGRAAVETIETFDVVAFTSRQAARAFAHALPPLGFKLPKPRAIAALGRGTAAELERCELHADLVGEGRGAAALAELLIAKLPRGARVLHPCAAEPDPAFRKGVERGRMKVVELAVYATRPIADDPPLSDAPLLVILASPSAARAFLARPRVRARLDEKPARIALIAGGSTTEAEIERLGRTAAAKARSPRIEDLVPAVDQALRELVPK